MRIINKLPLFRVIACVVLLNACGPAEQAANNAEDVSAAEESNDTLVAQTQYGPVRGVQKDGVVVFKGIRYGASTAGDNRFMPPQAPATWKDVYEASAFGNQCPQIPPPPTDAYASWARSVPRSEDCLFLNVWTPSLPAAQEGDDKRPVMVWLHGGGFAVGAGDSPVYDGERLAKRGDVILVTVNHRLNLFGYLHLADLGGEKYAQSANLGQQDLVAALRWVRDNIAAFGGDPHNVTIFGQSGGGAKVSNLLAMPSADGLFHHAIIQSGPGLASQTVDEANKLTRDLLAALNLNEPQIDTLQTLPLETLIQGMRDMSSAVPIPQFGPAVDGTVLPRNPFVPDAPAISADVPLMIGYTKNETTVLFPSPDLFELDWQQLAVKLQPFYSMEGNGAQGKPQKNVADVIAGMRQLMPEASPSEIYFVVTTELNMGANTHILASRKAAQGAAPVWLYRMEWETPIEGGRLGAPHALDLPLVFDTVATSPSIIGDAADDAQKVADAMSSAWISFARDGDPNEAGLPNWPAYDDERKATMIFNVESGAKDNPVKALREVVLGE